MHLLLHEQGLQCSFIVLVFFAAHQKLKFDSFEEEAFNQVKLIDGHATNRCNVAVAVVNIIVELR